MPRAKNNASNAIKEDMVTDTLFVPATQAEVKKSPYTGKETIIIGDDGEKISKVDYIFQKLVDIIDYQGFAKDIAEKPSKAGSIIRDALMYILDNDVFTQYTDEEAMLISANQIKKARREFNSLLIRLPGSINFVPLKNDFAAFLGVSLNAIDMIMEHGEEAQKAEMRRALDRIATANIGAAQGGVVKEKATADYLSYKKVGHSEAKAVSIDESIDALKGLQSSVTYLAKLEELKRLKAGQKTN